MATSKVVCCILLPANGFKMGQLAICASPNFVNNSGLPIYKTARGTCFPALFFAEESVGSIITSTNGLITWYLAISLSAMLEVINLPASISDRVIQQIVQDDIPELLTFPKGNLMLEILQENSELAWF
ncbi:hypothetical protein VNO77_39291 [Canavalia gladiata]|uniref:Uncharacterized protein n=1 Tax=Canavalia gladiata TaxID=3824 RepID=A0AAN9KAU4_CANGL